MRYILKIHALGTYPEIEIDKKRYESISKAKETLINALEIEEKYEIFISNYLELEEKIQSYTIKEMVRQNQDYEDFFEPRMEFNIRVVNLLTAARLYKDQLHRHVRAILPDISDIKQQIVEKFSNEYDENLEYRFIEELRNYVQHKGTPVHWTQHNSFREPDDDARIHYYSMELAANKEYFSNDKSFKKKVLNELPEQIDLKMAIRVYVECTSRVHIFTRKIIQQELVKSRKLLESAINEYKSVYKKSLVGLNAMCVQDDKLVERKSIILKWDDIRLKLTKRNGQLINLRNRCALSRIKNP